MKLNLLYTGSQINLSTINLAILSVDTKSTFSISLLLQDYKGMNQKIAYPTLHEHYIIIHALLVINKYQISRIPFLSII